MGHIKGQLFPLEEKVNQPNLMLPQQTAPPSLLALLQFLTTGFFMHSFNFGTPRKLSRISEDNCEAQIWSWTQNMKSFMGNNRNHSYSRMFLSFSQLPLVWLPTLWAMTPRRPLQPVDLTTASPSQCPTCRQTRVAKQVDIIPFTPSVLYFLFICSHETCPFFVFFCFFTSI